MKKSRTAGTIALLAAAVFLFAGRQAKVKAADAAYVSGTADVRIIQTEASYSSGAEAAVSFSPKEADMDGQAGCMGMLYDRSAESGRNGRGAFHGGASR